MISCQNCTTQTHFCPQNNNTKSKIVPLFQETSPITAPVQQEVADQNLESAAFIRFVEDIGLPKIFEALSDPRLSSRISYSLSSLCMWGFCTCVFRQGSKNAMQTSIESIVSAEQLQGIQHLLGIEGEGLAVPHSSSVDNVLSRIESKEFNNVFLELFDRMVARKFFYHHQDVLLPYGSYQIGTDGYWVHSYKEPHCTDDNGKNACPYCLPRVHNRGKPNEKTTWVHVMITFVLICNGITLPLYVYPLKSNQIANEATQSEEAFKEECEIAAASAVLPLFRERYPRTSFTFLGDALYAKRPFIKLLNQLKFDYIIVLKDGVQKNLAKRCDGLAKTDIYKNHYTSQETEQIQGGTILRRSSWFNTVEMGEGIFTNVLRFEESITKDSISKIIYKGSWICSKKIFQNNCFKMVKRGRSRWDQEDFHNTCKNRGFDIAHDMARINPNLCVVWKILVFIAFFVTELFRCTTLTQALQGSRTLMKFAKDMLQQLIERPWVMISASPILKKAKVQFRFYFAFT